MVLYSDVQIFDVAVELAETTNEVTVLLVQTRFAVVLENIHNLSNLALSNISNDYDVLLQR